MIHDKIFIRVAYELGVVSRDVIYTYLPTVETGFPGRQVMTYKTNIKNIQKPLTITWVLYVRACIRAYMREWVNELVRAWADVCMYNVLRLT